MPHLFSFRPHFLVRSYNHGLETSVGLAAEELAGAGAANELSGVNDGAPAREDGFGCAFDPNALEHGIVHAHVMRFRADHFFVIGIEEDEISVRADGDRAFAWVQAKQLCRRGGHKLDETVGRKMLAVDAAGVHQA